MRIEKHLSKGIWAIGAQLLQLAYGVAAIFLVLRTLPADEFGSYVLAQGMVQFITLISVAMVYRYMIRELSKDDWEPLLPYNSFLLSMLMNLVIIAPIFYFRSSIADALNAEIFGQLLQSAVPLFLLSMFFKTYTQKIIISMRQPFKLFVANGTYFLILIIGLVYLNLKGNFRASSQLIYLSTVSAFASALIGFILSAQVLKKLRLSFSLNIHKNIFKFGKYSVGAATANLVTNTADSYLISYLSGPIQVAYYNSAKFIYKFYQSIPQVLDVTLYPYSSKLALENRISDLKALYEKILCYLYLILLPLNIIAFYFSEPLLSLLYKGRYEGSYVILQILIIASTFIPVTSMSSFLAFAENKPKTVLYGRLITLVIAIAAGLYLVPEHGAHGMAGALLFGFLGQAVYMTVIIKRNLNLTFLGVLFRVKDAFKFVKRGMQSN